MLYLSCKCHKIQNNSQILLKRAEISIALFVFKGHVHPYTFFLPFLIVCSTCIANAALGTREALIVSRLNNTKVYLTPFSVFKIIELHDKAE